MSPGDELYTSFLNRVQQGEPLDFDQFCRQHPDLADSLTKLHRQREETGAAESDVSSDESESHLETFIAADPPEMTTVMQSGAGHSETGEREDATVDFPAGHESLPQIIPNYNDTKRYRVEGEIDRGGMGVVLRVWDENLKRILAMKVIRGQEQFGDLPAESASVGAISRFIREAEITGLLDHPGVVPVHEIGHDAEGRVFFTMRLIQGESLSSANRRARLKQDDWSTTRALELIVKVCDTVAYAHSRGIIHRDLKPANIMIGRFGETYVMDWGLAKILGEQKHQAENSDEAASPDIAPHNESALGSHLSSSQATLDGSVMGTPSYMPPEQAQGKISELDVCSDIYSVGAILYELLAGVRPYTDATPPPTSKEVVKLVIAGPPTPIGRLKPKVSPELIAICEKAMARSRAERYPDMREMAEDLRAYLENRVVRAYQSGAMAEFRKWVKRNRKIAVATAAAILFLFAGLGGVIGIQSWSNLRIQKEKEATAAALVQEQKAKEFADQQRKFADDQRNRAEGLFLEREAEAALSQDRPATATLLALEAFARVPSSDARNVLLAALEGNSEKHLLTGHDGDVNTAEFSPDGNRILTASQDRTAALWDAATGRRTGLLVGHQNHVTSASFNQNGRLAATSSYDGTAAIWDVESGRRLHVLTCEKPVMAARFSPDGARVATAGFDNRIRIWDAATGVLLFGPLAGHTDYIRIVEFSRDGTKLLTGSADKSARIWNAETGELLAVLAEHGQPLSTAQFSPDGRQVITAAAPRSATETPTEPAARLWDANNGQLLAGLESDDGAAATTAAFSPDGRWIAVGFADGTASLWDTRQAIFARQVAVSAGWIRQVGFSRDGRTFFTVTSTNSVLTWNSQNGNRLATMFGHTNVIFSAQFSPDGASLVTASRDATARVWRTDQNSVMPHLRHADEVVSVRLARGNTSGNSRIVTFVGPNRIPHLWSLPGGSLVATLPHSAPVSGESAFDLHGDALVTSSDDGNSYLWSAGDGRLQFKLANTGIVSSAVFDEVGHAVLIISYVSKKASKWDVQTGEVRQVIDLSHALMLISSPNGRNVLVLSTDQFKLQMWDADTGDMVWESGPSAQHVNAGFSPDGRIVGASEVNTNVAQLWSTATGEKMATLHGNSGNFLFPPRFSVDGASVFSVSQDGTCRRWSTTTGRELARFEELGSAINKIDIGGRSRLVTQANDHTTTLWNFETGKPLCPLGAREPRIQEIRFSRDGRFVLTSSAPRADTSNQPISIWDAETGELLLNVSDGQLVNGADFSEDGKWVVSIPRAAPQTVCFSPLDPAEVSSGVVARILTADERDLHRVGSKDERDAFRRQAAYAEFESRLTLAHSLRANTEVRIQTRAYLADNLNQLVILVGPQPSRADLQRARMMGESLSGGDDDFEPLVLSFLAQLDARAGDFSHAVVRLESAVQYPSAKRDIESLLEQFRQLALPDFPTYASLDAALAENDGSRKGDIGTFRKLFAGDDANQSATRRGTYLQARLDQIGSRFEDAVRGYREVIRRSETPAPEPYLHLSDCLRLRGDNRGAERVLCEALAHPGCRTFELWNRWLACALVDSQRTPAELLETFPATSPAYDFGRPQAEHLRWLLSQLAERRAIRIHCGGDEYVDSRGDVWASDCFFTHGSRYFEGQQKFVQDIEGTDDDPLYQTERWFDPGRKMIPPGYRLPLPPGRYQVTLHFAEIYRSGVRAFDVVIEGRPILQNYDPSPVGFATADVHSAEVEVRDGLLEIDFLASKESAKISAIEVMSLD